MLLSSRANSSTPLVMACLNGYLDVAKYLIEKYGADVEEVGFVRIGKETIDGASPLWCAASYGHFNLVKLLLRYGACVNSTTIRKSTPLRTACFSGYLEIVKYLIQCGADVEIENLDGHTCLMLSCYMGHYEVTKVLVEHGADVNRKMNDGKTALHECITKSGSLDMVKLLLKYGAKFDSDSYILSPILLAALDNDDKSDIVEYLIQECDCTKQDKVNGLELLGATFIGREQDKTIALNYWRQAMELRYENKECLLKKKSTESFLASYFNETEIHTFAELEKLILDPEKMKIQALLVIERILGLNHPDTIFYIRLRGARYADENDFGSCIKFYTCGLCVSQKVQKPFSEETHCNLFSISEICSEIVEDMSKVKFLPVPCFFHVLQVFEITMKEIKAVMEISQKQDKDLCDTSQFKQTVIIALHLVGFMCSLKPHLNKSQESKLKAAVYQLVHMNIRFKKGFSPLNFITCYNKNKNCLHLRDALHKDKDKMFPFPSSDVINLLLEVGACPDALSKTDCN